MPGRPVSVCVLAPVSSDQIPTAYLVGRLALGADTRQYGSGNVGGRGLWHAGVRWAIVPVGLFGIAKAVLPTWLGLGPLYSDSCHWP